MMRVGALQSDIVWEDPAANFARLEPWIAAAAAQKTRLLALPEMFACGFSMDASRVAEPPDGETVTFLAEQARQHGMWLAGSLPIQTPDAELPANVLVVIGPSGEQHRYAKIHPFTYAGEHESYRAGDEHVTIDIEGLRVTLFVCYDLRFADEFWAKADDTDAYLVVANWPETRRQHWQTLLRARAIENQAYVVGVNRVGDGGRLHYSGDSRIIDPMGEIIAAAADQEALLVADLDPGRVADVRHQLPFLPDRR